MIKTISIQNKIILTISYIAVVVPTFLVALLAITYYYLGIEKLFSEKISDSINDTVKIANLYLNEHNNNIKTSALMAAGEITQNMYFLFEDEKMFTTFLDKKAQALGLSEIVVFIKERTAEEQSLKIIGKTSITYSLLFETIPPEIISKADEGEIMVKTSPPDKVQALLRIDLFMHNLFVGKVYILVGRYVDSKIMQHLEQTQEQADIFSGVKKGIKNIRKKVITAFLMLSLIFLLLSIIISKKLAAFILKPINNLSDAITMFKLGKSNVKVTEKTHDDEINILAKSFNRMIDTITSQHNNILQTKALIEERNHFIEAMMSELSAGVIVLDKNSIIEMSNLSAQKILATNESIIGYNYETIIPECSDIIRTVLNKDETENSEIHSSNINIIKGGKNINLLVKVQLLKTDRFDSELNSWESNDKVIITLDDITAVVSGQRFKAWADIARRLAHEIKNPLTPIQLAVDRLESKFLKQIKDGTDVFQKYIKTINSRVEDIKKMLTDFVEFAGISTLNIKPHDIASIISDVIFLQKHECREIEYIFNNNVGGCIVMCEKTYISQVMTNLVKNASESIMSSSEGKKGIIKVTLEKNINKNEVIVLVEDNGIGISADIIDRICEPYVTTKATGTGLGLSIVKKIVEEHKSEFHIKNGVNGGTIASFSLPISKK